LRVKQVGLTGGRLPGVGWTQILPSPHACSPPGHLQEGSALGTCPVLTAPSHSQKALKVTTPTAKARGDPGPATLQEDSWTQSVTNCLPCPAGRCPACPNLGFNVPSFLPVICLNLRILGGT
jgi:hypothetical protein